LDQIRLFLEELGVRRAEVEADHDPSVTRKRPVASRTIKPSASRTGTAHVSLSATS
jgi:hypothetical protein